MIYSFQCQTKSFVILQLSTYVTVIYKWDWMFVIIFILYARVGFRVVEPVKDFWTKQLKDQIHSCKMD